MTLAKANRTGHSPPLKPRRRLRQPLTAAALMAIAIIGGRSSAAEPASDTPRDVIALLEDDGVELLPKLTNPQGGSGEGHVETENVFAGKSCIRIVPDQRYARSIPGWNYRIVEKPSVGEYRFLRFAWKAPGCGGIMLQLHDERDWNIRYTAGIDKYGWGTRFLAGKPPEQWSVVTVDLFKEFGARTLQGMALTCFDGPAGYFDHIYLGRTVDDLDRIDATGSEEKGTLKWSPEDLESAWQAANSEDAAAAYRAFWALANAKPAGAFLAAKLRETEAIPDASTLAAWITQLDDDDFEKREAATRSLTKHARVAADLLDAELKRTESEEARKRIHRLLKLSARGNPSADRALRAVRILAYSGRIEAREALGEIAKGPKADRIAQVAREALERSNIEPPKP